MSSGRWRTRAVIVIVAGIALGATIGPAAADEPKVPQQVADYFATGLIPRLIDLYGSGTDFDATTRVGTITRVRVWTEEFLSGRKSDDPTRLTNDWVAPVSIADKPLGLAMVWINPSTDLPELAAFDREAGVVGALAASPKGALLIHDVQRSAWFALAGTVLTPLVAGTSGVTAATTPDAFQAALRGASAPVAEGSAGVNQGLLIAGITLGIVVLLLAIFVLLPSRRRTASGSDVATANSVGDVDAAGDPPDGAEPVREPSPIAANAPE